MRLLEKSKVLVQWLVVLAVLLLAFAFFHSQDKKSYEKLLTVAHKELKYSPYEGRDSKYKGKDYLTYNDEGWEQRYESYEDYAKKRKNPVWFVLMVVDGVAIAYVGLIKAYNEYSKVSAFISEQAKLEEQQEQQKQHKPENIEAQEIEKGKEKV